MSAPWLLPSDHDVGAACITCGDVAVPLTVVEVVGADARCRADDGGEEVVAIELVDDVTVGDRLLVHARVALERLDGNADTERATDGSTDALRR